MKLTPEERYFFTRCLLEFGPEFVLCRRYREWRWYQVQPLRLEDYSTLAEFEETDYGRAVRLTPLALDFIKGETHE